MAVTATTGSAVRVGRAARLCLDAAGITDPHLRGAYELCRRLNADHGKTYYLATLLMPPAKRPHVWALYGFARYADEFVDSLDHPDPRALIAWGDTFLARLGTAGTPSTSGEATADGDAVAAAMASTMRRWSIPCSHVEAFLESMRMDITVTDYPTYADLQRYMYGSACVIGLQMLPILGPLRPEAATHAQALGEAFQMTNFLRDIGEDLTRGRVYLPQEDMARFGVSRADLESRVRTPAVRRLLEFEVTRTRALYAAAEPGIGILDPTSRDCVRTACVLYRGILDEIVKADYDVLARRVSVPLTRRLRVALPGLVRARRARRTASAVG